MPDDWPVAVFVDDNCGCCSTGGGWEQLQVELTDGMVKIR